MLGVAQLGLVPMRQVDGADRGPVNATRLETVAEHALVRGGVRLRVRVEHALPDEGAGAGGVQVRVQADTGMHTHGHLLEDLVSRAIVSIAHLLENDLLGDGE